MSVAKARATWVAGKIKTRMVRTPTVGCEADDTFSAWCPMCDWRGEGLPLAAPTACPRCSSRLVEDRIDMSEQANKANNDKGV